MMKRKFQIIIFILCFSTGFAQKPQWNWDKGKDNWTPLMYAIYENNIEEVCSIVKSNPSTVTEKVRQTDHPYGVLNALVVAIKKNNLKAVELLIQTKMFNDNLSLYFDIACGDKNASIVELINKEGVDVNEKTENGHTYLMSATMDGSLEVMEYLLKNDAEINSQTRVDGMTALMLAAFNGSIQKVQLLLQYGANKYLKDFNSYTAYDYVDKIYPRLNISEKEKRLLKSLLK